MDHDRVDRKPPNRIGSALPSAPRQDSGCLRLCGERDVRPGDSDLDFVVDFLPVNAEEIAPDYFGLLHALEDLFRCKIDLVMEKAIKNPYFRRGVDKNRKMIYAA